MANSIYTYETRSKSTLLQRYVPGWTLLKMTERRGIKFKRTKLATFGA